MDWDDFAGLLTGIPPREIHLIREDHAHDCVELSRQLQMFFLDMDWPATKPRSKFYETVRPGIRVRAMAGDETALAIRRALAHVLKISIGAEDPGAQKFDWVEIEIGGVLS